MKQNKPIVFEFSDKEIEDTYSQSPNDTKIQQRRNSIKISNSTSGISARHKDDKNVDEALLRGDDVTSDHATWPPLPSRRSRDTSHVTLDVARGRRQPSPPAGCSPRGADTVSIAHPGL